MVLQIFLQRPLQLIYPLEIRSDLSTITIAESQETTTSDESLTLLLQRLNQLDPQRKAAVEAS